MLQTGPDNPFKTEQQRAKKNMLTGFVERAHISEFRFENERRAFDTFGKNSLFFFNGLRDKDWSLGYARDPAADSKAEQFVGDQKTAIEAQGVEEFYFLLG